MTALSELAARENMDLRLFQESDHLELMMRLVQTECLLVLSRLADADLGVSAFTARAVEVLEQMLPVLGCRFSVRGEGLPRVDHMVGDMFGDDVAGAAVRVCGAEVGRLAIRFRAARPGLDDYVDALASQLSTGLERVAENHRLRRQAALANCTLVLTSMGAGPSEDQLRALAAAAAELPAVAGVSLMIEHPVLDDIFAASLGEPGELLPCRPPDGGRLDLAVAWTTDRTDDDTGAVETVAELLAVVLDKAEATAQLAREASTDPLTGIANRRQAMQALEGAVKYAAARQSTMAVACLDLDQFKEVNDRFGHVAGDQVLVRFAKHLTDSLRRSDTVARIGGEEFLIILPGSDHRSSREVIQRIVTGTPGACLSDDAPGWNQTTSVGIAVFPDHGDGSQELLRVADAALYSAKRNGRNRVETPR